MKTPHAYRPEIDGLRAVAVLAVILYHAGVPGFGGGYVGVDVFFVISGYLITLLIVKDLEAGTFSLAQFYERRARRILPALAVVLLIAAVMAWGLFLPPLIKDIYQSIGAAAGMASNVLFWTEQGYFNEEDLKPLLHTWSLGVEEQFYLLYPLGLSALLRAGRRWFMPVVAGVALASLAAAQWVARSDPNAAFFLLPTRAWELLFGACLSQVHGVLPSPEAKRAWRQAGAAAGLALIGGAVVAFTADPQPASLAMPVLGAGLVILCATPETVVGKLLGSRPARALGLISYSAYLLHQPIFVATRMTQATTPDTTTMLVASAASLLLAWPMWKFVEQPFRRGSRIGRRAFVSFALIGIAAFGTASAAAHLTQGFDVLYREWMPARTVLIYRSAYDDQANPTPSDCRFAMPQMSADEVKRFDACALRHGAALIVTGDSHGRDLYDGLRQVASQQFLVFVRFAACDAPAPRCAYRDVADFVRPRKDAVARVIYFGAGYPNLAGPGGASKSARALLQRREPPQLQVNAARIADRVGALARIAAIVGEDKVAYVGPYVEPHLPVAMQFRYAVDCRPGRIRLHPNVVAAFDNLDADLAKRLKDRRDVRYVSAAALFAPFDESYLYDCDAAYFRDLDHLTAAGQRRLAERLLAAHPELVGGRSRESE